jgi:hypothetical protein
MRWVGHKHIWGDRRGAYHVLEWKPRERDHLEDQSTEETIILKWVFKTWDGGEGIDRTNLTQDRDRWTFVNAGMNLWILD